MRTPERTWSSLLQIPVHPVLVAAYPIAAMTAANLGEMSVSDAARSLAIALLAAGVLWLLGRPVMGDWRRAATLASLLLLLFFSYGHVYRALKTEEIAGLLLGRHRFLLPVWLLTALAGAWAIRRSRPAWREATLVANLMAAAALAMPAGTILVDALRQAGASRAAAPAVPQANAAFALDNLPDVYYVIADSYARSDIMKRDFGFDNGDFVDFLLERGFYVADQSQTNYLWTHLSLASSLNLDYLQTLVPDLDEEGTRLDVGRFVRHSLVRRRLEDLGYSTIGFTTGWVGSELVDAEYVMTPVMTRAERLSQLQAFNDFEGMLVQSTALQALIDLDIQTSIPVTADISRRLKSRFDVHREVILALFDNLERVPSIPGPKFVFVHILSPHGPYIFGPNGEPIDPHGAFSLAEDQEAEEATSRALYRGQAQFVTQRLREAIDVILDESERPVVIILQSDHGPSIGLEVENPDAQRLRAKSSILNAYYVPDGCRAGLYPTISPVNSFRLLFECLYGDPYPRMEDITWWGYHRYVPMDDVLAELEGASGISP
jgi:hypothetical protein